MLKEISERRQICARDPGALEDRSDRPRHDRRVVHDRHFFEMMDRIDKTGNLRLVGKLFWGRCANSEQNRGDNV
jgi:hypothetical protein